MKYWAPINSPGGINGNDPYVNGNPSIGVQGSIPTFQSFEQTLRGLQNLIVKSGMTPNAAIDDLQISEAIRSQRMNWRAVLGGTANAWTCTLDPAPAALADLVGMPIRGRASAANTGACTLQVNALVAQPVVHPDGTPLLGGEVNTGMIMTLVYDGTKFQIISMMAVTLQTGLPLTQPLILYVRTDGNDANDGSANDAAHAFKTGQAAMNKAFGYGPGQFGVTIKFANGTYPNNMTTKSWQGPDITIEGNVSDPSQVILQMAAGTGNCISCQGINAVSVKGVKIISLGTLGVAGANGITGQGLVRIAIENCEFGYCGYSQMGGEGHWLLGNNIKFSGNATYAVNVGNQGQVVWSNRTVTIMNPITMLGAFMSAAYGGLHASSGNTFVNAGMVTGKKFAVSLGSGINTLGSGLNYFPGNEAGVIDAHSWYN